jgi:hypothetical protein
LVRRLKERAYLTNVSYKLWVFSELVSFSSQEVSLIPSKESCIGQVTIKQFVFVEFEVLT